MTHLTQVDLPFDMAARLRLRVLAAVVVIVTPSARIGMGYGPDHARRRA